MADQQNKYAYLDQLSTEQLEELLRADVDSNDPGTEEVILHILEVIEKREQVSPTGRLADTNAAWEEFQKYYNIPEGNGQPLYPCGTDQDNIGHDLHPSEKANGSVKRPRPHRIWRGGLVAVAAMAALLCGMVAAQAAGVDVFGALGRWTDETFHFITTGSSEASVHEIDAEYYEQVQSELLEWGVEEELFPTWQPDGFVAQEPRITNDNMSETVSMVFMGDKSAYYIRIVHFYTPSDSTGIFEKDDSPVEVYIHNDDQFYIFSNADALTATCFDGEFMTTISGALTMDEVKMIIDSIGGE